MSPNPSQLSTFPPATLIRRGLSELAPQGSALMIALQDFVSGGETTRIDVPACVDARGRPMTAVVTRLMLCEHLDARTLSIGRGQLIMRWDEQAPTTRVLVNPTPGETLFASATACSSAAPVVLSSWLVAALDRAAQLLHIAEHPRLRPQRRAIRAAHRAGCAGVMICRGDERIGRALARWSATLFRPGETITCVEGDSIDSIDGLGGVVAVGISSQTPERLRRQLTNRMMRDVYAQSQDPGRPFHAEEPVVERPLRAASPELSAFEKAVREVGLIGDTPALQHALYALQRRCAAPPIQGGLRLITLLGPTGAGKELFARLAGRLNPLDNRTFIAHNAAATPTELQMSLLFGILDNIATGVKRHDGAIKLAGEGTLFLDEIGYLGPEQQAALLRLLNDGSYRTIGSSAKDEVQCEALVVLAGDESLARRAREGRFLAPLWHRITHSLVRVPALEERLDDIPVIVQRRLHDLGLQGLTDDGVERLRRHTWPGNVRELLAITHLAAQEAKKDGVGVVTAEHLQRVAPNLSPLWLMMVEESPVAEARSSNARFVTVHDDAVVRVITCPPVTEGHLSGSSARQVKLHEIKGLATTFDTGTLVIGGHPSLRLLAGEADDNHSRWPHLTLSKLELHAEGAYDELRLDPNVRGYSRVHLLILFGDGLELVYLGSEKRDPIDLSVAGRRGRLAPGERLSLQSRELTEQGVLVNLNAEAHGIELTLRLNDQQLEVTANETPGATSRPATSTPRTIPLADAKSLLKTLLTSTEGQLKKAVKTWCQGTGPSLDSRAMLSADDKGQFLRLLTRLLSPAIQTIGRGGTEELVGLREQLLAADSEWVRALMADSKK